MAHNFLPTLAMLNVESCLCPNSEICPQMDWKLPFIALTNGFQVNMFHSSRIFLVPHTEILKKYNFPQTLSINENTERPESFVIL